MDAKTNVIPLKCCWCGDDLLESESGAIKEQAIDGFYSGTIIHCKCGATYEYDERPSNNDSMIDYFSDVPIGGCLRCRGMGYVDHNEGSGVVECPDCKGTGER